MSTGFWCSGLGRVILTEVEHPFQNFSVYESLRNYPDVMAEQLLSNELYASMNSRLSETISKLGALARMTGTEAPDAAQHLQLLTELDALTAAPLSQALDKADIWKNRLRETIMAYRVPAKTREDVLKEFNRDNTEFRSLNGWAQSPDKMLQKGEFGYHQFHPLTGCVDPEPILFPYTPDMKVFYEQKCVRRISDSKMINLPATVQNCMELSKKMGLGWSQIAFVLLSVLEHEIPSAYEDVKDIKAPEDLMEAIIGTYDFRTERNRVLKLMKMCHRKRGMCIRSPVIKYRNLVKELIMLEGVQLTEAEIQDKADREALKVMFKFLEPNTAAELKDYKLKKSRDEVAIGQASNVNLHELFDIVGKLEKMRGYQLMTDKHLITVDHEVALFFTNLNEVPLDQDEIREVLHGTDGGNDMMVEMLFNTQVGTPAFNPRNTTVSNTVPEKNLGRREKPVAVEQPAPRKRSRSRTRENAVAKKVPKPGDAEGKPGTVTPREKWIDSSTDDKYCVICGEKYADQQEAKCKENYCAVYHRPTKHKDDRFCIHCAKERGVKAFHPRMWCKSLFEATAKKLFMMSIEGNESEDDTLEEKPEATSAGTESLNH